MKLDVPVHRLRVERASTAPAASNVNAADSSDEESVDVLGDHDDAMDDSMIIDDHHLLSPATATENHDRVPLSKWFLAFPISMA